MKKGHDKTSKTKQLSAPAIRLLPERDRESAKGDGAQALQA
jgi:hypothetical protein